MNHFLDNKRNVFILAFIAIFLESLTSACLKIGGRYGFLSTGYFVWFIIAVVLLGVYAVIWQLILERLPLTTAYLRRGISYILIFVWAILIFGETITLQQIIGIVVITIGMVVSMSDEF
ncbi:MAG TPA: transporter [Lachnospiraceae bacterium]|jgi:drug/metabolite transporter (DMT)-like permease|nr:transporter [Lachnospiraceae bacterium]